MTYLTGSVKLFPACENHAPEIGNKKKEKKKKTKQRKENGYGQ